jgi:hypothetical protein
VPAIVAIIDIGDWMKCLVFVGVYAIGEFIRWLGIIIWIALNQELA